MTYFILLFKFVFWFAMLSAIAYQIAQCLKQLPVGTRSLLFGVHQVFLHPWFVAWAYIKMYGWPWHPAIWLSFVVHDWGYWGKHDMDGPEGETHVELGAKIVHALFDGGEWLTLHDISGLPIHRSYVKSHRWHDFCLYHSRFYAKKAGRPFSRLCVADKLAICLTPRWLYLPLARLSGEIEEYKAKVADGKYQNMGVSLRSDRAWYESMVVYLEAWCEAHKNGGADTWTPDS